MSQFVYRAVCKHGKVHMMVADIPEMREEIVGSVSTCLKNGLTIERVTDEEARKSEMFCDECKKERNELGHLNI